MRVGYTSGVFDLFHVGHLNLLRRARKDCDYLFVAVATDEIALELTGIRPRIAYPERLDIVRSLKTVDAAIGKLTTTTSGLWEQLRFDVVYKGDDWARDERGVLLEAELSALPVEIVYLPFTTNTSSERLRSALDI